MFRHTIWSGRVPGAMTGMKYRAKVVEAIVIRLEYHRSGHKLFCWNSVGGIALSHVLFVCKFIIDLCHSEKYLPVRCLLLKTGRQPFRLRVPIKSRGRRHFPVSNRN